MIYQGFSVKSGTEPSKSGSRFQRLNRVMDAVNNRYGEFTLTRATLLHRSDMPNAIAPA